MAIFRLPKITTTERTQIILSPAEIVFDIDTSTFYGGDGLTLGGFEIGKDIQLKLKKETISLTQGNINDKKVTLIHNPQNVENIILIPQGGIEQIYDVDFTIIGKDVHWNGLGLDGFLEVDDIINVIYFYY